MTVLDVRPLVALRESGSHAAAREWLAGYLARCPADAEALADLGEALRQRRLIEDALTVLRRAIELQPDIASIWINYGVALQQAAQPDKAKPAYQRALMLKPDSGEVASNLGALLVAEGDWSGALALFDRAFALLPHRAEIATNRAVALSVLRRCDEASKAARVALSIDPKSFRAVMVLADIARGAGSWSECEKWLKTAIEINPTSGKALVGLANTFLEMGRTQEALSLALDLTSHQDWPDFPLFDLGAILVKLGDGIRAQTLLRKYLELYPSDPHGARLLLAAAGADVPAKASEAHLQRLYGYRAETWGPDTHYPAAELVAKALERLRPGSELLDIVDLGCGTGPVGRLVRGRARRLDGVDISAPMLARAHAEGIYDELICGDLIDLLNDRPQRYDVATCAATLIHFGDLSAPFESAAQALRPDGLFIFTLFPNETDGVGAGDAAGLAQGGCFTHGPRYVARAAEDRGFSIALIETEVHEPYAHEPRMGLIIGLQKR